MQLTDEQKSEVSAWVRDGATLSEVQKRLSSEFGISMTYMDVRFLVIDLELEIQEPEQPEPSNVVEDLGAEPAPVPEPDTFDDGDGVAGMSGVSVDIDRLQKPGFLVSGTVKFSDGVSATWGLDQFGRLAIDAAQPGYKPSDADVQDFQVQLQSLLAQKGF